MASLTIEQVGKTFGAVRAIKNVSIDVADGEFLVLVGPSGCGKSTLLRMIAGLESLTEGRVLLGERDVSRVDPKDRDVAMVFQNYALYPHMTVFENMAFSLQQRRIPRDQIQERVMQAARVLDLEPLVHRKPGALSGGQRQRVAMGRAIVRSPAIYLMDEPLSNLDAKLRVQMRAELKLLRKRLGVTTIYVTHDQTEAMTLGDRVAVLSPASADMDSNLQQCAEPQTLYMEPCNMFVAGFIGSPAMNFMYADIHAAGEALMAAVVDTDIKLALDRANTTVFESLRHYAGNRVVLGIRPEFFGTTEAPDAKEQGRMPVEVLVSEAVGPDTYLHFRLDTPEVGADLMKVLNDGETSGSQDARFTARIASEALHGWSGSGPVDLSVALNRLHFFDPDTTDRIR